MEVKNFEDLEIWKDARLLTKAIYRMTKDGEALPRTLRLRDQIRRAAVSIMSNIAEGFERGGNQEFIQFLYVAKASCGEVRSHLYVALDQSYVEQKDCDAVSQRFVRLSIMISNLIDYLKREFLDKAQSSSHTRIEPIKKRDTLNPICNVLNALRTIGTT